MTVAVAATTRVLTLPRVAAALAVGVAAVFGALRWAGEPSPVDRPIEPRVVGSANDHAPEPIERVVVPVPGVPAATPDEPVEWTPPIFASLEGRLRDQRGTVAGVEVTLVRLALDAFVVEHTVVPQAVVAPPLVVGTCTTDSGGRFVFDAVPPGGIWLLRVVPPASPGFVQLVAARPDPAERVDLGMQQLPVGYRTEGRIVDPRLRALGGVRIARAPSAWLAPDALGGLGAALAAWSDAGADADALLAVGDGDDAFVVRPPPWLAALVAFVSPPPVVSGADGRFAWWVAEGPRDALWCTAAGFESRRETVTLARDGAEHGDITLETLDTVELTVLDPAGRPVADATVAAGVAATGRPTVLDARGTTDGDGVVRLATKAGVPLVVAVSTTVDGAFEVRRIPPGLGRTVRLAARHPVRLRCVDPTGVPVEGIVVRVVPDHRGADALRDVGWFDRLGASAPLAVQARADDDGWIVDDVPEGAYALWVGAPGCAAHVVTLEVRGPVERRIELTPLEPLRVEVLDSGFRPLRGVALIGDRFDPELAGVGLPERLARTDADAACVVQRAPWRPLRLGVGDPGRGVGPLRVDPGAREAQLVLRGTGAVEGVVANATADFRAESWLLELRPESTEGVSPLVLDAPAFVAPPADGIVRIAALTAGAWRIAARPVPPPLRSLGELLDLVWPLDDTFVHVAADVRSGSTTPFRIDPVVVPDVEPEPEWAFRGRVLLDGAAVPGLLVTLERGGRTVSLALDEVGAFDAGAIPAGEVALALRLPGAVDSAPWWHARFAVQVGDSPRVIDIATAAISALLTTADGARADGVHVELRGRTATDPIGESTLALVAERSGFVASDRVPAGRYAIHVTDPERGWLRRDGVRVGHPEITTGMSLRLDALLRASGTIGDVGIAIPATSEVEFVRDDPDGVAQRRIGVCREGGAFTIERLLPGHYTVRLRAAVRQTRADGTVVLVGPELSGVEVPLADVDVPAQDGARFALRGR